MSNFICVRHCLTCKNWQNNECTSNEFQDTVIATGAVQASKDRIPFTIFIKVTRPEHFDCRFYLKMDDRRHDVENRRGHES